MRKRKRTEAPVSAPVSARARRLAAAAAAVSEPVPAVEPAPAPIDEAPVVEDAPEMSSSDEEVTANVEAAEKLALKETAGPTNGRERYFARDVMVEEPSTEPASPAAEPFEPVTPSKANPRPLVDEQCRSTYAPLRDHNLLYDDDHRILGLAVAESIIVHGCARIKVLRGRVTIAAAQLDPSSAALDLIAPSTHPLPVITALAGETASSSASATILPAFAVVIRLAPLITGIEGIERPLKMGGMLARSDQIWPRTAFELVLQPSVGMTAQRVPDEWQRALTGLGDDVSWPRIMVEGAKRTGKSTFSALTVNAMLASYDTVAYLDTDLGQTEFTPPGLVSLHVLDKPVVGPAFTHLRRPLRAHFLGVSSPAADPQRYSEALADLIQTVDDELSGTPIVINTQGWLKGLGEDLLRQLRTMARPTIVVQLGADGLPDTGDMEAAQLVRLPAIAMDDLPVGRFTAADSRAISVISYFHRRSADSWNFTSPLVAQRPRVVDWQRRGVGGIDALHVLSHHIERGHLLYALNASIVGIVALPDRSDDSFTPAGLLPYAVDAPAPGPTSSHCIGLAIIRGIDTVAHALHLLAPIVPECAVALTRGDIELPTICMLDWTAAELSVEINGQKAEYLSAEPLTAAVGAVKRRARKNLQRR